MDPIEIGCMDSSILQSRTCVWPVVSQPLGACNRYRAPSLKSSRPCNNIQLFSLKKLSDSQRIMNISSKLSWTWDHRWVVRVRSFWPYRSGNDHPPPSPPVPPLFNFILLIIFFFCSIFFNYYRQIYRQTQSIDIFQRVWNNLLHMSLQHCYITNWISSSVF